MVKIVFLLVVAFSSTLGLAQKPSSEKLIDATSVVPGLAVDIRYATPNNFTKQALYDSACCLLRPQVAAKLARAQELLIGQGFRLKTWDCYRPLSVQKIMWDIMPVKGLVASPQNGSNHNRGAAVDVTLVYPDGQPVKMPTEFDDFSKAARAFSTLPSSKAQRHRAILQKAMKKAGFLTISSEWWHFNAAHARKYSLLDIPLSSLCR